MTGGIVIPLCFVVWLSHCLGPYHILEVLELLHNMKRRFIRDQSCIPDQRHKAKVRTDTQHSCKECQNAEDHLWDGLAIDIVVSEEVLNRGVEGHSKAGKDDVDLELQTAHERSLGNGLRDVRPECLQQEEHRVQRCERASQDIIERLYKVLGWCVPVGGWFGLNLLRHWVHPEAFVIL